MIHLFFLFSTAFASVDLEELKKHDFSIRLRDAKPRPEQRCFLRPEVNGALSRVQQKIRLVQANVQVLKCYTPSEERFAKGAAVQVKLLEKGTLGPRDFANSMRSEGFKVVDKGKGIYLHETWDTTAPKDIPVEQLP